MALYTDYRRVETTVTDAAAINNAIRNILLTQVGTLPGKPTFGSNIKELLFSQLDYITISLLKTQIRDALEKWETRINVVNVEVQESPEYNKIIATIYYAYNDMGLEVNESIAIGLTQ